jgi:hypothetical protein
VGRQWRARNEFITDPLVEAISYDRNGKLLAAYGHRPTTRRHVKVVLQMMLTHPER